VVDGIRSLRVARTSYNVANNSLTMEPEVPIPSLVSMIAAKRGKEVFTNRRGG